MLSFLEFYLLEDQLTKSELDAVEKYADQIFKALNIDIAFTKHFLERVNDIRNRKQITKTELIDLFRKERQQYGQHIASLDKGTQAIMHDLESNINIPFVLKWDKRNKEMDLVSKTIMRKKDFKSSNSKLTVR